nr:hypothetical protein [Pandoravirus massiliensis]
MHGRPWRCAPGAIGLPCAVHGALDGGPPRGGRQNDACRFLGDVAGAALLKGPPSLFFFAPRTKCQCQAFHLFFSYAQIVDRVPGGACVARPTRRDKMGKTQGTRATKKEQGKTRARRRQAVGATRPFACVPVGACPFRWVAAGCACVGVGKKMRMLSATAWRINVIGQTAKE